MRASLGLLVCGLVLAASLLIPASALLSVPETPTILSDEAPPALPAEAGGPMPPVAAPSEAPVASPSNARAAPPRVAAPAVPVPAPVAAPEVAAPRADQTARTPIDYSSWEPGQRDLLDDTPYGRLVQTLASNLELTPTEHIEAMREYFHASGYNVPEGPGDYIGDFDVNETITYTYELGDVNDDGTEDVALDVYCTGYLSCPYTYLNLGDPAGAANYYASGNPCRPAHHLFALNGANGSLLWDRDLDHLHPVPLVSCSMEFVVAEVPLDAEGHRGLLLYRYDVASPLLIDFARTIHHKLSLVEPRNGTEVWALEEDGVMLMATDLFGFHLIAQNVVLNPLHQFPKQEGVAIVPRDMTPSLFVQGVSFNYTYHDSVFAPPGFFAPLPIIDSYQPDEWAARLDPVTGAEIWRQKTFVPDGRASPAGPDAPLPDRSVFPELTKRMPYSFGPYFFGYLAPSITADHYWLYEPCCGDLTGDGQADLLYTTEEWGSFPSYDPNGPYFTNSSIVLIDGASGRRVYSVLVEQGTFENRLAYDLYPQLVGDVNGDGDHDILLHQTYLDFDYYHNISIRDGGTGDQIWRLDSRRNLQVLPLGDADGDGGTDFVLTDWIPSNYGVTNVTLTPLSLMRGADGTRLWTREVFTAPIDLFFMFQNYHTGGVPDFDGDGVGDIPFDDPVFLSDLTVVHQQTVVSGATATPLFDYVNAGAYSFPCLAGDLTGDGREDFLSLNGDVNDLWITTYNGTSGEAEWSRRVFALRVSNYALGIPRMKCHALDHTDGSADDLLLTFHFQYVALAGLFLYSANYPQITAYDGQNGSVPWALPHLWDKNLTVVVLGPSPASAHVLDALAPRTHGLAVQASTEKGSIAIGLGSFAVALTGGFFLTGRRWRK